MGIKLGGSGDFDAQDYQVLQAVAANTTSTIATSEDEVIDKFKENNNIDLSYQEGYYFHSYTEEPVLRDEEYDGSWTPNQSTDNNLNFSNISLGNNPKWIISDEGIEIEDAGKEDNNYKYFYRIVTYQYKIEYKHIQSSGTLNKNIWTNNARVIYHRKTCSYSYEEPVDDGYEGSDTITIILEQKIRWEWKEEKEQGPDGTIATTFGAFPSGISAEYCILVTDTNVKFVQTYSSEEKLNELNDIANTYAKSLNSDIDTYQYFGSDSNGPFIYLTIESVTESLNNGELGRDWNYLHQGESIPDKLGNIVNENCKIIGEDGEEQDNIPCYKVYLAGRAQLAGFDCRAYLDSLKTEELKSYNFPNGYYFLINDTLYLFLLTDLSLIEWNGNLPEKTTNVKITFNDYSNLGNGEVTLSSRQNSRKDDEYYLYQGKNITDEQLKSLTLDIENNPTLLMREPNVRNIVVSDSVTSVSYLGQVANPTEGYVFPKYLEHLGPLSYTTSGYSVLYIYADHLIDIADYAFGSTANPTIYLASEKEIEKFRMDENNIRTVTFSRGYIAPTDKLEEIGIGAFGGVYYNQNTNEYTDASGCTFTKINLTACKQLKKIGRRGLASVCTDYRILTSQQSERVQNKNLIYLPENTYNESDYIELTTGIINENSPKQGHLIEKKYSVDTYQTLGSDSTACNIYVYHPNDTISLDDLLKSST